MRIAVTGAGGQLGADLAVVLGDDGVMLDRAALDVTDAAACVDALGGADAIIHAAAWTDVDGCEGDPARAREMHVTATENVVRAARGAFVVVVSTDFVFDGRGTRAYIESDPTAPLSVYGRTKRDGEIAAVALSGNVAIARTAWLYGARRLDGSAASNFVTAILRGARDRRSLDVVDDQVGSPTWTADLARALRSLCVARAPGVFHVVNTGAVSRYGFARAVIAGAGMDASIIHPIATADAPARAAARPMYAPLDAPAWRAAGFAALPPWGDALARALPGILRAI